MPKRSTPRTAREARADPLAFASRLEEREANAARKGARTRARLLRAAARELDTTRVAALQIDALCAAAGVAKGTFYVHFETKETFLEELCREYVDFEATTFPDAIDAEPYGQVHATIAWYERVFAANVGVLRCLVESSATHVSIMQLWLRRNRGIVDRIVANTLAHIGARESAVPHLRPLLNSIGGMLDQSLYARYHVGPEWILGEGALDASIELHALIAYRAVFGANPRLPRGSALAGLVRHTTIDTDEPAAGPRRKRTRRGR